MTAHSSTRPTRSRWEAALGASASVSVHIVVAIALSNLPPPEAQASAADALEWQTLAAPTPESDQGVATGEPSPVVLGGASASQNVDEGGGRGGDLDGAVAFTLLVSRPHPVNLQDSVNNSARVSQAQRIRVARDRASYENRRATPNPASSPFLASGDGNHQQRQRVSRTDATQGSVSTSAPSVVGDPRNAQIAGAQPESGNAAPFEGAAGDFAREQRAGAQSEQAGLGIAGGQGSRRSRAARVAHARPDVDRGPAATLALTPDRVRDDVDSERLAAQLVESTVEASRRAGRRQGAGQGGAGGGGIAASDGAAGGAGGLSTPHQPGSGNGGLDTSSRRYRTWYLALRRRIDDALVFPRERMLSMDQGQAVFRIRVARNGALEGSPRRMRSSGFHDLDAAARTAIVQTAPYSRLPDDLAPGSESIQIDLTVAFENPMVR